MGTTLLIARHGNTFGPGDVVTRVGGRTDLPLVESGREQGLCLGNYLNNRGLVPDFIFTSSLKRTIEMADMIEQALGRSIPRSELSIFSEIDYGPDEGRPEAEVVARIGMEALKAWDTKAIVPNGWRVDPAEIAQSWRSFAQRVVAEFLGKRVLVISSNGIIRFAPVLTDEGDSFYERYQPKVATGALCRFEWDGEGEGAGEWDTQKWHCKEWNVKPSSD